MDWMYSKGIFFAPCTLYCTYRIYFVFVVKDTIKYLTLPFRRHSVHISVTKLQSEKVIGRYVRTGEREGKGKTKQKVRSN